MDAFTPHSPNRNASPQHDYNVINHPPFNVATKRFNKHDAPQPEGPQYHVAYRDVIQPTKRATKGWSSMDDAIKGRRGTGAGKVFSSLAPQTAPPAPGSQLQPIYTSYPNETRLQELLDLQRRRLGQGPGPGQYEVTGWQPSKTCFRRQALPQLDGPFLPPRDGSYAMVSTREREMEATLLQPDSGVAPGEYNGHAGKDATMKSCQAAKIGTGVRAGRIAHPKSLSVSRSIQHGIDWHIPVLVQVKPAGGVGGGEARESSPHSPAAAAQQQQRRLPSPGEWGDEWDGGAGGRFTQPEPPLPAPVGGKPPPPPAAVAKSIRRTLQGLPSEWDWQRLGHNYRNNWTTLHGGAFSQGDRSTSRRDVGPPDAVDYMGPHTESIDPSSLPREALGDIFPIPEEGADGFFPEINDVSGRPAGDGVSRGSDGRADSGGAHGQQHTPSSMPSTASSLAPAAGGGGGGAAVPGGAKGEGLGGGGAMGMTPPSLDKLMTQGEVQRREAALNAALMAQEAAARRAAWNARAGMVM